MNNNGNDIESPQNDIFGGAMSKEEFLGKEENEEKEGYCDVYEAVMKAIFISKPLGIIFDNDLIEDFLVGRGYKIVERTDDDGEIYTVPVKVGSKIIPDRRDSLRRVFDREIQEVLMKWIKSIS